MSSRQRPGAVNHFGLVPGQRAQARIASVYGRAHALKVVRAAMADYDDSFAP
jgi:hypothetical protein